MGWFFLHFSCIECYVVNAIWVSPRIDYKK